MKRAMNLAAVAALALAASFHAQARAQQTLDTPGYTVKITQQCEEGNVTCDDVRYVGTSKKSGKAISLRGKTMHAMAADGVTPGAFQGYVFRSGRVTYTVFADGRLVVTEGKKTLVNQRGEWK
ncbi:hypothetical protein [Telluria beijingensis]|uniref:hypothetical protein n=1 Tax=Telluria beijingensis TaxID=3068633 RepID=UPI00279634E5|nr:hypothetical protein [Massilia sp. REN29]